MKHFLKHPHIKFFGVAIAFELIAIHVINITDEDREKSMMVNRANVMERRRVEHAYILQDMGYSGEWGRFKHARPSKPK